MSAFVTTTFTSPAACAVVVPVMLVGATVETVIAEPPNDTDAPVAKPVPVTVTDVPPSVEPLFGATDVTVGAGATYVKQPVHVPLCVSGLVTTTSATPEACAVVVPVIVVALTVATVKAEPPNEAVAPAWKSLPVIVTEVPPAVPPVFGATEVTVGGGVGATYVKQLVHVPVCASGFVTATLTAPAA